MASWHPSRRLFAAGLGLSLAVHFGVGFVARVTPVAGGTPPSREAAPVEMAFITLPEDPLPERPEPERVELGLERSDADTDAWLGYEDATDHQAPESEVEQSALTPLIAGGRPTAAAAMAPSPKPIAEHTLEPEEPHFALEEPAIALAQAGFPAAQPSDSEASQPAPPQPTHLDPLLAHASTPEVTEPVSLFELLTPPQVAEAVQPEPDVVTEPPEPETSAGAPPQTQQRSSPDEAPGPPADPSQSESAQAVPTPQSANSAPGEGGQLPGEKSPSESTPASLHVPIEVRPGRVAAGQGLQITTVRPVFDLATMALARPRSPTLVIEFGKDGAVRRARYLPGRTTGDAGVDQPLLDAVYRWTAKGEALERLADEEDQTVSITMRIILR